MKKIIIVFLFLGQSAIAQTIQDYQLGFRFSPSITSSRVDSDQNTFKYNSSGSHLNLTLGPVIDLELTSQYYLSSGLLLSSHKVALERSNETSGIVSENYKLQYLMVPVGLKLYTNEVTTDIRAFVNFGVEMEFKVRDKGPDTRLMVGEFNFVDSSIFLALGGEYQLMSETAIFVGFSYHRGLLNSVREGEPDSIKNDMFSIDLGVKL